MLHLIFMNNMFEHFDTSWIGTTISTGAGAFFGWFFGRRKQKADARQSELENVEKAISIWKNLAEEMEVRMKSLQAEVDELRKNQVRIEHENEQLKIEIEELRKNQH